MDSASHSVVSPSSRISVVWKHFSFEKDDSGKLVKGARATCKLCMQKVAHSGGTTNLKNHLRTKHRSTYDELFEINLSETQSTLETFIRPAVKKFPPHSPPAFQLTDAIADFIARDLRPVSVVDGDGFLQLMQLAEPRFVVPCRKTMMSVIDRKYTALKRTVH